MGYFRGFLIAVDQLLNAMIGGWPDETLSSHAWRSREHRYWWWTHHVIDTLFYWQSQHCYWAYMHEQERRQIAPEFRPQ